MRLIGPLGLLIAAALIFASPGKARIAHAPVAAMPSLRGEAATEYLKQQGLYSSLGEAAKAARYGVYTSSPSRGEAFYADNPGQRWRAGFTPDGLSLRAGSTRGVDWEFGMRLRSAGYGERQMAVSAGRLSAKGPRLEYERAVGVADCGLRIADLIFRNSNCAAARYNQRNPQSEIIEWYVNKAEGLEQGFTLAAPIAERVGDSPLVLRLELAGDLQAHAETDGRSVTLSRKSGERTLAYDHLAVVDAQGRKLAARLEAAGNEVRIVVDDRGASYPVTIDPTFREIKKLTASGPEEGSFFGQSVAIFEDTAIVGAPFESVGGNFEQGAAYIFRRNNNGTDQWGQVKKLTASDASRDDWFGISVAIYEDTALIGASFDTIGGNRLQGSVYIFERNQGGADNWGEVKKLIALDGQEQAQFGRVAIYEDTVIVGAPGDDIGANIDQGSVYIFERNQGGPNNWGQVKKISASDGRITAQFGSIMKIYRDTLIVGAPLQAVGSNLSQGAAYIFERNRGGADNWGEVKKLTASDGAESDFFGMVAIYEDTVIVGAFRHAVGSNLSQGAAYIFERNQGGADNWGEVKKLTASDGAEGDAFGVSAAIYEDTVIVGASGNPFFDITTPGSAYVFERNQGGADNWGEVKILAPSDSVDPDFFGISTAIYEDTVIVGAPIGDIGRGAAYIYAAGNSPPTISAAGVTRAEGAAATKSTIAAVSDPDQGADTLMVTVNGSPSATVNGVTVSNITVEAAGEVRADVVAACGASNAGFTLRVTDNEGLFADATLDVTVTPEDVAPALRLRPSIQLWPPNHNYRTVTVAQMVESVMDNCSPLGVGDVVIEKVTSDEPDDAPGHFDGNTTSDIVIAPDCRSVQLRAERAETNDGRVYSITLRLRDGRGNATRRDFEVSVPIDQSGVPAVKGVTAITVKGGCQ
jgi:hypothetical protein